MNVQKNLTRFFDLKDDNWLRHANPWSVWTRFATLPFLILSIWSRVWIGRYSLIPIIILIVRLKINPTLFKKPNNFDSRSSKSVLGEKIRSEKNHTSIPAHHKTPVLILTILQILGAAVLTIGLWKLDIHLTIIGTISIYFSKMRFLDRMVWTYEEMNSKHTDIIDPIHIGDKTLAQKTMK